MRSALTLIVLCLAGCSSPSSDEIRLAEDLRAPDSAELRRALGHGSPEIRARSALAMGRIQSAAYVDGLVAAAADSDTSVRLAALFALGQLGLAEGAEPDASAQRACVEAFTDTDAEIVVAAVTALGKLAPEGAAASLTEMLKHPEPVVRREAAYALFRLRFVPVWRRQSDEPPPLPDAAVSALLDATADADPAVRLAAVFPLSRYAQRNAAARIAGLTDDSDEWVRLFAVRALGRAGEPSVVAAVSSALDDESPRVRTEAVGALAALEPDGDPGALAADPDFHVRVAVARALATGGRLQTLRTLVRDPSPSVRAVAIDALTTRLDAEYADELTRHLQEDEWTLRVAAATAAGRLGDAGLPAVRQALDDEDSRVRTAGLESHVELAGVAQPLIDALASADLAERGTAVTLLADQEHPEKLELLTRAYDTSPGDEWIEIREAVVEAAADLDGAAELLRRMSGDPAFSVRTRAQIALGEHGLAPSDPGLPSPISPSPYLSQDLPDDARVVLETEKGDIVIRCLAQDAPIHVAAFLDRVRDGFYDGLIWHRVVSNFVIQGGDPRGDGWGSGGYTVRDEINTQPYLRGTVGMPKAGKDTGGCQIFITHVPTPHLDGNYTVFGRVESGMDVVDRIEVGDRIVRAHVD